MDTFIVSQRPQTNSNFKKVIRCQESRNGKFTKLSQMKQSEEIPLKKLFSQSLWD
jgi:hypothetical protein